MSADKNMRFFETARHFEEVEQEIKSWIPHINIVKPNTFREKINTQLNHYLKQEEKYR